MPDPDRMQQLAEAADKALGEANALLTQSPLDLTEADIFKASALAQVAIAARLSMLVEVFGGVIDVRTHSFVRPF